MKRRFLNSDLLLAVVVCLLFVGGFFFVIYEPDKKPTQPLTKELQNNQVSVAESGKGFDPSFYLQSTSITKEPVKAKKKILEDESGIKNRPLNQEKAPEIVSATADFGIEGVVFSLGSGLPLTDCKVSFAGQKVTTDASGEFHLWLDGGVGTLSFSYGKSKRVQIRKFDISAGNGLAHFDVYLDESGKTGTGRIEVNGVTGRVYSRSSGAPLAGAGIALGNLRGKTDSAGFFELWGNDTDLQTMRISAPGYVSEMISGIDFENQNNPFFYEILLDQVGSETGRKHVALVGIGARLIRSAEGYEVADLLDDSPAVREGLLPGDRLVAVDSLAVDDFSLREVVELIRGQAGFPVTMMVERDGDFLEFTCTRERVVY